MTKEEFKAEAKLVVDNQRYGIIKLFSYEDYNKEMRVAHIPDDSLSAESDIPLNDFLDELYEKIKNMTLESCEDMVAIHTQGLDEGIRCAMCTNSLKNDSGCDGGCVVDEDMYKEVMNTIRNHIVPPVTPTQRWIPVSCMDASTRTIQRNGERRMKYIAVIEADEKPVSCEFLGCNGNVTPYLLGATTNIKEAPEKEPILIPCEYRENDYANGYNQALKDCGVL